MQRHLASAFIAAAAVLAVGCATTGVIGSHVQRAADFGQYRSYDWAPADALPPGDPRFESHAVFRDHVYGSVDKALAARGLERSAVRPGLLVHYHVSTTQRIEVERFADNAAVCAVGDCPASVTYVEAGTLVLDVVDARTERVIWRGWVQQRADDMLRNPHRIDAAVERMLEGLPAAGPRTGER